MHISPSDLTTKKIQTRDLNVEIVNHNHMTIYILYMKKNQMALVRLSSLTKKKKRLKKTMRGQPVETSYVFFSAHMSTLF